MTINIQNTVESVKEALKNDEKKNFRIFEEWDQQEKSWREH